MDPLAIVRDALCACEGGALCQRVLPSLFARWCAERRWPPRAVHLVGAGKAAVAMARGVGEALDVPVRSSLLVTKRERAAPGLEVMQAGHPEPDARSERAAHALAARLASLPPDALVLAVLSGGASALLGAPVAGLTPGELASATRALLGGGVPIAAVNLVRRHLTLASGGRLAARCAAPIEVLVLSDVLGDDLAAVGSGPFAPDPSTYAEALAVVAPLAGFEPAARRVLAEGAAGLRPETPKPADGCFARVRHHLVGSYDTLVTAARARLAAHRRQVLVLPPSGDDVVAVADRLAQALARLEPGGVLLGGGEPTVRLPDRPGTGGRAQQLALLMAERLAGGPAARFLAVGSDGDDGGTDAAGAIVDERSWQRLHERGDPAAALRAADAHGLLDAIGALVRTGPTGTNLLDLHLCERVAADRSSGPPRRP